MNVAPWLVAAIEVQNKRYEDAYAKEKVTFANESKEWVDNAVINRAGGTPILPFKYDKVPVQHIAVPSFIDGSDTAVFWVTQDLPADPNLHMPVLPPPVSTKPSEPFIGGGADRDIAVFQMLAGIASDLAKIKQAMNLT